MPKPSGRLARLLVALLALVFLTGCASAASEEALNPWAEEFAWAYERAENEFVRAVLSDGVITHEEFLEAQAHTMNCWDQHGVPGSFVVFDDMTNVSQPTVMTDDQRRHAIECERFWIEDIWWLYEQTRINPGNVNFDDLVADCLIRHGLAPVGFSGSDFAELALLGGLEIGYDPDEALTEEEVQALFDNHVWYSPRLPGGAYLDEGQAWECRINPHS